MWDIDKDKAKKIARRFNIPRTYTCQKTMLAEIRPDAVHVLAPPKCHADLAIQAMGAGYHVLVEKPIALTVEDVTQMIEKSRERNVKLAVCHTFVFDPMIRRAKKLIDSEELGDVVHVEVSWFTDIGKGSNAYTISGNGTGGLRTPGECFWKCFGSPGLSCEGILKRD